MPKGKFSSQWSPSVTQESLSLTTSHGTNKCLSSRVAQISCQVSRRNTGFTRSTDVMRSVYLTSVRSLFGYATPIWAPQSIKLITKIERTQRRATKYILKLPFSCTISYMDRLKTLDLLPLTFCHEYPQASQSHVTSHSCKQQLSQIFSIDVGVVLQANAIYHFKIYKRDLPLMYSCVFWCEFIDLVVFFGFYCLTPVTLLSQGLQDLHPVVLLNLQSLNVRQQLISLRSKRFQSSYSAKVRAGAKKKWKGEGEGRRGNWPVTWEININVESSFYPPFFC